MNDNPQQQIEEARSWLDDIGSGFLKVESGKQYEVFLYDAPVLEPSPFKDRNGQPKPDRRTYTLEHEGRLVKYSPGSTWERQLKEAMLAKKIYCTPLKIQFRKVGDGNTTNWNMEVESLIEPSDA